MFLCWFLAFFFDRRFDAEMARDADARDLRRLEFMRVRNDLPSPGIDLDTEARSASRPLTPVQAIPREGRRQTGLHEREIERGRKLRAQARRNCAELRVNLDRLAAQHERCRNGLPSAARPR
jgi:hypothetical protein